MRRLWFWTLVLLLLLLNVAQRSVDVPLVPPGLRALGAVSMILLLTAGFVAWAYGTTRRGSGARGSDDPARR